MYYYSSISIQIITNIKFYGSKRHIQTHQIYNRQEKHLNKKSIRLSEYLIFIVKLKNGVTSCNRVGRSLELRLRPCSKSLF